MATLDVIDERNVNMGKKSNKSVVDLSTILNAVHLSDKNAGERHKDITSRLENMERKYDILDKDVKTVKKKSDEMRRELDYLFTI